MKTTILILISTLLISVDAGYLTTLEQPAGSKGLLEVPLISGGNRLKTVRLYGTNESTVLVDFQPPFVGQISLGTPEQTFKVAFDTAVTDLWIQSVKCSTCKNGRYDSSKSSSYLANGKQIEKNLLDVLAHGFLSSDILSVGGQTLANQTFVELTNLTSLVESRGEYVVDGNFGLGFNYLGTKGVSPPLKNMVNQKLINHRIVSIYQKRAGPNEPSSGSVLFGGIDTSKFTGDITYTSVLPITWAFRLSQLSITVDGIKFNGCTFFGCICMPNSATPITKGPKKYVRAFNEAIGAKETSPGSEIYQLPTCDVSKLPDLTFTISGKVFSVKPHDYVLQAWDQYHENVVCVSSLTGQDMDEDGFFWVLGSPFIGTSYTVLDFDASRIGFATLK